MRQHSVNQQNLFIQGYYIDNVSLMREFIHYYKNSTEKCLGVTGNGKYDPDLKDSIDVLLKLDNPILTEYYTYLNLMVEDIKRKYPDLDKASSWGLNDSINLQHYKPKGGYHLWHWERSCDSFTKRVLTFMTYLNDVNEGGETSFKYQNLKIKPETGLTLFWPVDWTHTHRGEVAPNEDKYIMTGWYSYNET